jgi:hypothetical protein
MSIRAYDHTVDLAESKIQRTLGGALPALFQQVAVMVDRYRLGGLEASGLQGLVISPSDLDRLIEGFSRSDGATSAWLDHADWGSLDTLAEQFGLSPAEQGVFLAALGPDLAPGVERVYGFLNDDVTQRRATIGLAFALVGVRPDDPDARAILGPSGPLVRNGLVVVGADDRPFLSRSLTVPDSVADLLLGADAHDPLVAPLLTPLVAAVIDGYEDLARAIDHGARWSWIVERPGTAGASMAAAALATLGAEVTAIDVRRLPPHCGLADVIVAATRDATLRGGGLVVVGVDAERDRHALNRLEEPPCPVVLVAHADWSPNWSPVSPFVVRAPVADLDVRRRVWGQLIDAVDADLEPHEVDPLVNSYRLCPEQIVSAVATAAAAAAGTGQPIGLAALRLGARAQTTGRLGQLARHVEPAVSLDQIVLPVRSLQQLREVVDRAVHRELVCSTWGMGRPGGGRAMGVKCLLTGPPGTGKTLSAEAVACELGVDLYVVDLSQIVDKYVGETEKNLERVFAGAAGINAVLFFDEADALFGKRGDVKGAQDRYANVEVSYLLQRMEQFDGVAILASNMPSNFDEAFMRRLDVIVRFTVPEASHREELWRAHLPPQLPIGDDVDLELLAEALAIPGASIANICLAAAFDSAARGVPVGMAELVVAATRALQKEGRLPKPEIFGPWETVAAGAAEA